jgi:hypothetical protein
VCMPVRSVVAKGGFTTSLNPGRFAGWSGCLDLMFVKIDFIDMLGHKLQPESEERTL